MADHTLQYRWIVRLVGNLRRLLKDQSAFVARDLLWYPEKFGLSFLRTDSLYFTPTVNPSWSLTNCLKLWIRLNQSLTRLKQSETVRLPNSVNSELTPQLFEKGPWEKGAIALPIFSEPAYSSAKIQQSLRGELRFYILKLIPYPNYRFDELRFTGIRFHLFPQSSDMGIHHSLVSKEVVTPQFLNQLRSPPYPSRMAHKRG